MGGALTDDWALWMRSADRSPRTVNDRLNLVERFTRDTGADPTTCDWRVVAQFLTNDRFSRSTKQQYRAVLRQWFAFLILMDQRTDNPVDKLPRMKNPRHIPRPVTVTQVGTVLGSGRYYRRTRTMLILGMYQGMRAGEISRVRGEHIQAGHIRIIGKGGRERVIPVHELVQAEAAAYPRIGLWFPSPQDRSKPVTPNNVSRVLSEAIRRSQVDATGHQLRHFYGTESLKSSGGNLRHVQELLGHASVATTEIYTHVEDEALRATVDALPVPLYALKSRSRRRRMP